MQTETQRQEIVIDCPSSEASGLLAIENREVLRAHGWDIAFWICSDEATVEESLSALGRKADGTWEAIHPRKVRPSRNRPTEDSEALAHWNGQVWVFGSQFGKKEGPLSARRQFVARFDERALSGRIDETEIDLEVVRGGFHLHRLINDALRAGGLELIERGEREAKEYVGKARKKGKDQGKIWAQRIEPEDWPINLEAATFMPSGNLLLGLRYPVTRQGQPILLELSNAEAFFQDGVQPEVRAVRVLDVGSPEEPRGFRALERVGDEIHAITGNLDSSPDASVVVQEHPEGAGAISHHHRLIFQDGPQRSSGKVHAERIHIVEDETRIEGLSTDSDGKFWYVLDDEKIRLLQAG
jgi:hypothetical protein